MTGKGYASCMEVEEELHKTRAAFYDRHVTTCQHRRETRTDLSASHDRSVEAEHAPR